MEKNEVIGLLIFAAVAVVGAVLLVTNGLNMSDENTGLATKTSITDMSQIKTSNFNGCMSICERDRISCESTAYNGFLSCSGNYKSTNCQSKWDKAKISCADKYYPCAAKCNKYLQ